MESITSTHLSPLLPAPSAFMLTTHTVPGSAKEASRWTCPFRSSRGWPAASEHTRPITPASPVMLKAGGSCSRMCCCVCRLIIPEGSSNGSVLAWERSLFCRKIYTGLCSVGYADTHRLMFSSAPHSTPENLKWPEPTNVWDSNCVISICRWQTLPRVQGIFWAEWAQNAGNVALEKHEENRKVLSEKVFLWDMSQVRICAIPQKHPARVEHRIKYDCFLVHRRPMIMKPVW